MVEMNYWLLPGASSGFFESIVTAIEKEKNLAEIHISTGPSMNDFGQVYDEHAPD